MVYHDFVNFPKLAEVVQLFQYFRVSQPRGEADHKHQVFLNNPDIGQVFPILGNLQLFCLILLSFLGLDFCNFFTCKRLEVRWIFRVWLPASRAQTIPLGPQFVPAKPAYLKGNFI